MDIQDKRLIGQLRFGRYTDDFENIHPEVIARYRDSDDLDAAIADDQGHNVCHEPIDVPKHSSPFSTAAAQDKAKSTAKKVKMIKIGKLEILVWGLNADGDLLRNKALSGPEEEKLLQYHLARKKDRECSELGFGVGWEMKEIDEWLRELFPELFEYLDIIYGSGEYHWVLVKKDRFSLFAMRCDTFTGDDLVEAKGSAARGWHDCRSDCDTSCITFNFLQGLVWSDCESPKTKSSRGQGKGKAKAKARSVSSESAESEEPLLSEDSDLSGVEDVVVKQEPGISLIEPRRSARFAAVKSEDVTGFRVKVEPDTEVDIKLEPDVSTVAEANVFDPSSKRLFEGSLTARETQTGKKLKKIRVDGGGEWINHIWRDFGAAAEIIIEVTTLHSSSQNLKGRGIRATVEFGRCFMSDSGLPQSMHHYRHHYLHSRPSYCCAQYKYAWS
ncbi:hypothetical protein B0H13DRAFT_2337876 [Mycena leptocephala]|nr:hypothetical protein B0H13DRAFT_2337876 [Mycena leptocephala]